MADAGERAPLIESGHVHSRDTSAPTGPVLGTPSDQSWWRSMLTTLAQEVTTGYFFAFMTGVLFVWYAFSGLFAMGEQSKLVGERFDDLESAEGGSALIDGLGQLYVKMLLSIGMSPKALVEQLGGWDSMAFWLTTPSVVGQLGVSFFRHRRASRASGPQKANDSFISDYDPVAEIFKVALVLVQGGFGLYLSDKTSDIGSDYHKFLDSRTPADYGIDPNWMTYFADLVFDGANADAASTDNAPSKAVLYFFFAAWMTTITATAAYQAVRDHRKKRAERISSDVVVDAGEDDLSDDEDGDLVINPIYNAGGATELVRLAAQRDAQIAAKDERIARLEAEIQRRDDANADRRDSLLGVGAADDDADADVVAGYMAVVPDPTTLEDWQALALELRASQIADTQVAARLEVELRTTAGELTAVQARLQTASEVIAGFDNEKASYTGEIAALQQQIQGVRYQLADAESSQEGQALVIASQEEALIGLEQKLDGHDRMLSKARRDLGAKGEEHATALAALQVQLATENQAHSARVERLNASQIAELETTITTLEAEAGQYHDIIAGLVDRPVQRARELLAPKELEDGEDRFAKGDKKELSAIHLLLTVLQPAFADASSLPQALVEVGVQIADVIEQLDANKTDFSSDAQHQNVGALGRKLSFKPAGGVRRTVAGEKLEPASQLATLLILGQFPGEEGPRVNALIFIGKFGQMLVDAYKEYQETGLDKAGFFQVAARMSAQALRASASVGERAEDDVELIQGFSDALGIEAASRAKHEFGDEAAARVAAALAPK
jgi:hypothetical protein